MRSWINRLAAREGKPVAFDVNEHMTAIEAIIARLDADLLTIPESPLAGR